MLASIIAPDLIETAHESIAKSAEDEMALHAQSQADRQVVYDKVETHTVAPDVEDATWHDLRESAAEALGIEETLSISLTDAEDADALVLQTTDAPMPAPETDTGELDLHALLYGDAPEAPLAETFGPGKSRHRAPGRCPSARKRRR